ncbi:tripartite tricarboxylate transporter TctB family protein [Alsobacter sp. R-9]
MKRGGVERAAEIGYIVLVLVVAFVLWREAGKLPPAPYDPLGPAAFPRWAAYGLGILGIAMAVRLLMGAGLGRAAQSLVTGLDGDAEHVRKPWIAVLTLLLSFAYAALLSTRSIPFLYCTGAYFFAGGAILGPLERGRLWRVAVVAAVAAIALDQLFRRLFSLDLT